MGRIGFPDAAAGACCKPRADCCISLDLVRCDGERPGSANVTDQVESTTRNTQQAARQPERGDRSSLMEKHVAARARRDAAALGSDEYREAAEEVGRIEVAIAKLEEPPPPAPAANAATKQA